MNYYSILFSKENTFQILNELGHLGIIDIEDSQPELIESKRPYHH